MKMSENRQFTVNLMANFIYLALNYATTFLLTSFVVNQMGAEAYGFISLCNKLVDYATLVTVALNSVAGRFITIEMHRGNKEKANKYFSSTLLADFFICAIVLVFFVPIDLCLEKIFEIPGELVFSVKILFIIITFNLFITVISNVYTVATFITNRLYLSSLANMFGNIVRAVLLIIFMNFVHPSIVYVGVASVLSSVIILIFNYIYTRKLCPELRIRKSDFSAKLVKELFFSGIWNSISRLAQILSDGLDLVISNIWIGAYAMSQLSIAYTVPTIISAFISMITNVFNPKLTEYYAHSEINKIVHELKLNMKMTAFFGNVIFFGMILMGKDFFKLWVPESDIDMVYILMFFSIISLLVSCIVSPLSNVFLMTNKLKMNSIIWLVVSVLDTIIVVILVNFTNAGVYAVAGVSKIVGAIVNLIFLPIYASRCLQVRSSVFYSLIIKYAAVTCIVGSGMFGISYLLGECSNWILFAGKVIALSLSGFLLNFIFFLNNEERFYLISVLRKKLLKR